MWLKEFTRKSIPVGIVGTLLTLWMLRHQANLYTDDVEKDMYARIITHSQSSFVLINIIDYMP